MSRPTAYRLLSTLATRGYTAQADGPNFRLGTQALSLSQKVLDSTDLPELARPYMRQLSDVTHETIHLSILEDTEILYIAKVESSQSIRLTVNHWHSQQSSFHRDGKSRFGLFAR